jgi:hypothetical protein
MGILKLQIDSLTEEQVKLLDKMWTLETIDDLEKWIRTLPPHQVHMVKVLRELLILSMIDEDVEEMSSYPEAAKMLKKFGV